MHALHLNNTALLSTTWFRQHTEPGKLLILFSNRKAPIMETALPDESVLNAEQGLDYSKSYRTSINDKDNQVQALDLAKAFHDLMLPAFIKEKRMRNENGFAARLKLGYTVLHKTKREVVVENVGKHLTVKHSLLLQKPRKDALQYNVVLSTAVHFHTSLGQFLFASLKPILEYSTPLLLKKTIKRYV